MQSGSVPLCDCGYLERAAESPDLPIGFDETVREFYFAYPTADGEAGRLRIRHCPWCGGKAPESIRGLQFATISHDEQARLFALTKPFRTVGEIVAALGIPEDDQESGLIVETPGKDGAAPTTQAFRVLTYTRLSETADVQVIVYPDQQIGVSLQGKYIGGSDTASAKGTCRAI